MRAWTFRLAPLPAGVWATTDHVMQTITIRPGLTQAERRSCLAHELEHVERGPRPSTRREELICDQAAARKLIDLRALGEALAWAHDLDEAAEELWVDCSLLEVRLAHLHPSERAYLKRRLAED